MGFSFKRMFKHPFGAHSVFHTVTHNPAIGLVAGAIVPPLGIVNAAMRVKSLVHVGGGILKALHGAPAGMQTELVPADMPRAMPGGGRHASHSHNVVKHRPKRGHTRGRSLRRRVRRR